MSSAFDWRSEASSHAAPITQAHDDLDHKEGYELRRIWIPEGDQNPASELEKWRAVEGLRFGRDDRTYYQGFISVLQLSDSQQRMLLECYAKRYRQAMARQGGDVLRHAHSNRTANQWLAQGAPGFIVRG